jgi:hypothetical protein
MTSGTRLVIILGLLKDGHLIKHDLKIYLLHLVLFMPIMHQRRFN